MPAIAERKGMGAAAATQHHLRGLLQPQLMGDAARAEMGTVAEPAVAAATAAAQLMHTSRQGQRNGTRLARRRGSSGIGRCRR